MEVSSYQAFKQVVLSLTHMEKDALHIHVGLGVYVVMRLLTRQQRRSVLWSWLAVLAAALTGELLDLRDRFAGLAHFGWTDTAHDIVNTLFWPTVLALLPGRAWMRHRDGTSIPGASEAPPPKP